MEAHTSTTIMGDKSATATVAITEDKKKAFHTLEGRKPLERLVKLKV